MKFTAKFKAIDTAHRLKSTVQLLRSTRGGINEALCDWGEVGHRPEVILRGGGTESILSVKVFKTFFKEKFDSQSAIFLDGEVLLGKIM